MTEIWKMAAHQIAQGVRTGEFSAQEATQAHLDRLAAVNPAINAVVQEFPDQALEAARAVDQTIAQGGDPGPLCGVPVTIKVNVDQQGHATTNGLTLQKDLIAASDSPVVSNLRKAGAVIVGRTNTPAFSMRWFTKNKLHGQTLNPRDKRLTPGGSSGGAAAAVASGICAVGHGTDIAGSIRYPAYACGLHGLRPTLGRVPAQNASAPDRLIGAQLMAVSGPIARTIADIDLSLRAMMVGDDRDPWWMPVALDQGPFERRAALCLSPDGMPVAPEVTAAMQAAARLLETNGWIIEEVNGPPMRAAAELNGRLWMAETALAAKDLVAKEGDPDAIYVFERMTRDSPAPDLENMMKALQERVALMRDWQMFLSKYPLMICPPSGTLPFAQQLDVRSDADFADVMEAQLTQRGLPTAGMPGLNVATSGLGETPVGVQLIAGRYREDILLAAGAEIEQGIGAPQVCDPS